MRLGTVRSRRFRRQDLDGALTGPGHLHQLWSTPGLLGAHALPPAWSPVARNGLCFGWEDRRAFRHGWAACKPALLHSMTAVVAMAATTPLHLILVGTNAVIGSDC